MNATRLISAILIVLISLNGWAAVAHASQDVLPVSAPGTVAADTELGAREQCAKGIHGSGHDHGWPQGESNDCCLAVFAAADLPSQEHLGPAWENGAGLRPSRCETLQGVSLPLHPRPPRA